MRALFTPGGRERNAATLPPPVISNLKDTRYEADRWSKSMRFGISNIPDEKLRDKVTTILKLFIEKKNVAKQYYTYTPLNI